MTMPIHPPSGKRVILGISGGIAAYKVGEVASTLVQAGVEVIPVMTRQAQQFVSPLTFSTLCRYPACTDDLFWHPQQARPLHIQLGETADLIVLAPLTANTLGKLAQGLADNLLTNLVLASTCPVLLVPAMNTDMWEQGSVQKNWQSIQTDPRYHAIAPGSGRLACDRIGTGRMADPAEILAITESLLMTQGKRDLVGKHILISAGSTQEYLDSVRYIGNPATGKMGVALAQAALHRGATVTLVHGPMVAEHLTALTGVQQVAVTSAKEMHQALISHLPNADWILMAAAVADVRPHRQMTIKLPKADLPSALPLVPVPDIVADLAHRKSPTQILVGFAAQTGDIVTPAQQKLVQKGLDAIVANPIDQQGSGFGSDFNEAILISATSPPVSLSAKPKRHLAHHLYDWLSTQVQHPLAHPSLSPKDTASPAARHQHEA